jgi:hypothetical protein
MQSKNRLFEDAAKVAEGAVGTLTGMRREVEALVRQQIERLLAGMDLVTRDEFEAVKEMATNARVEQEALAGKLAALEAGLGGTKSAPKRGGAKLKSAQKDSEGSKD